MGTVHSSSEEEVPDKMALADRRYRVSASKAASVMQRRNTRKLGSVTLEATEQVADGGGLGSSNQLGLDSDADNDEQQTGDNPSQHQESGRRMRRVSNRRRAHTLLQLSRTENAGNATILLTRTQRVLIENSWKRAKKGAVEGGMGAKVFQTVLIAQPDIKLLFGLEKVPQGRLKYEGQFRRHAGLLNRSLEYIVKNVQYTDKLGQHYQALGKKHCQMNGGRAFPTNYWDTFLECIIQSVLEMDGASGGRHHRCRETGLAWRNLISFIVQQMRRGFDDERLLRKRFSASLMGLRGSTSSALNVVYNGGESAPQQRAASGRPRPSLIHHTHGSLGSLEKMSGSSHSSHSHHYQYQYQCLPSIALTPQNIQQRARASSAVSPLTIQQSQHPQHHKMSDPRWDNEKEGHLQPRSESGSSARSASWCAEVSADELRRLQLNEHTPKRATRSELVIDNATGEAFYTPMMSIRNERLFTRKDPPSPRSPRSPAHAVSAIQLFLNAASPETPEGRSVSEGILLSPGECPHQQQRQQQSPARHSFSEFADGSAKKVAAAEASRRLLGMAQQQKGQQQQQQLLVADGHSAPRRLSAI